MISVSEIWKSTWWVKIMALVSVMGTPALILFLSVIAPFLLAPLLVLVTMFLSLTVFSIWQQHKALQHKATIDLDYSIRRDLYPIVKWGILHASISVATLPLVYILLDKFLPILFLPVVGGTATVFFIFTVIDTWIIREAEKEVRAKLTTPV